MASTFALCITVFLQAEFLFNIEVQDFQALPVSFAEATGRVMRKVSIILLILNLPLDHFFETFNFILEYSL